MQIEKYLKTYQPVIYKTFVNSLKNNRLSHAYLLVGEIGTPLLDTAKYLAKSILCDNPSPLACDSCITCLRIDSNNYPDFILFDGSVSTITDKNVEAIQEQFQTEAFEKKGIMIYVLHLVENITVKAINSILKMLEEPTNRVYAFLTTTNKNRILPTIISRCQTLQLNSVPRPSVIQKAIEYGVNNEDAELLSYFYNDAEHIYEFVNDEQKYNSYLSIKDMFEKTLNALKDYDKSGLVFFFENEISSTIRDKNALSFYLDMLLEAFEEIFNINYAPKLNLENYATILLAIKEKYSNIENILLELMKQKRVVSTNTNIPLIIDHLAISLSKEIK